MGSTAGDLWVQLTEPSLHSLFPEVQGLFPPTLESPASSRVKHWGLRGYAHALSRLFLCGPLHIQAAPALPGVCPALALLFKSAQGPGQVASERTC